MAQAMLQNSLAQLRDPLDRLCNPFDPGRGRRAETSPQKKVPAFRRKSFPLVQGGGSWVAGAGWLRPGWRGCWWRGRGRAAGSGSSNPVAYYIQGHVGSALDIGDGGYSQARKRRRQTNAQLTPEEAKLER